jgi:hypothetical protein
MDNFKGNRDSKKRNKNKGYELNGKFSSKHIRKIALRSNENMNRFEGFNEVESNLSKRTKKKNKK